MLIVTHEMRFAREVFSSKVVFLHQGVIEEIGTPSKFLIILPLSVSKTLWHRIVRTSLVFSIRFICKNGVVIFLPPYRHFILSIKLLLSKQR